MKRYFFTREPEKYQHFKKVTVLKWDQNMRVQFLAWLRSKEYIAFDIETTSLDQFSGEIVLYTFCDGQKSFIFDSFSIKLPSIPDGKNLWQNTTMIAHGAIYEIKWLDRLHVLNYMVPKRLFCTLVAEGKLLQGSEESLGLVNTLKRRSIALPDAMDKAVVQDFVSNYTKHEERHVLYNSADTEILHELMNKQKIVISKLKMEYLIYGIHMPLCRILAQIENTGWKLDESKWASLAEDAEKKAATIAEAMDYYLKGQNVDIAKINPDTKLEKAEAALERDKIAFKKILARINDKAVQYKGREANLVKLKVWKTLWERRDSLEDSISANKLLLSKLTYATPSLNWGSNKQVVDAWEALGLNPMPKAKSTTTGKLQPSIGVQAREKWLLENKGHEHYELIDFLDDYQKLSKHISSFGKKFLTKYKSAITGKFHTSYKQARVSTGRLASGDANAGRFNSQQIPRSNDLRNCFLADSEDYLIATCDLSGAELVTMAALAKDQHLLSLSQGDMHSYFANLGWKAIYESRGDFWNEEDVISKTQNASKRTDYKPMTFGTIYGLRDKKAASTLNVSVREGQIAINTITKEIPATINMVVEASKFASSNGYVIHNTRTNSRRWFPESLRKAQGKPYNDFTILTEESAARNSRIQGTQADMLAEAMVLLDRFINFYKLDIQIKKQVHDEIVVQFHKRYKDWFPKRLIDIMTRAANKYLNGITTMNADCEVEPYWTK